MRERAAELGGDCVIARTPPTGTRVAAWLPLAESAAVDGEVAEDWAAAGRTQAASAPADN
jgi:signal transduction histidine kinase